MEETSIFLSQTEELCEQFSGRKIAVDFSPDAELSATKALRKIDQLPELQLRDHGNCYVPLWFTAGSFGSLLLVLLLRLLAIEAFHYNENGECWLVPDANAHVDWPREGGPVSPGQKIPVVIVHSTRLLDFYIHDLCKEEKTLVLVMEEVFKMTYRELTRDGFPIYLVRRWPEAVLGLLDLAATRLHIRDMRKWSVANLILGFWRPGNEEV